MTEDSDPSGHYLHARALLRAGEFARGWLEYEWRLKIPGTAGGIPPDDWPRWDGSPMPDRRLLIFCDQGRGDVILFSRYIPWAAERCRELAVCCPGEMWPVLRQFRQIGTLVEQWYQAGTCAAYVPLGSLPLLAGTRVESIPTPIPYLSADPALAAVWRARLDRVMPPRMPRVGLVWAGNPSHFNDRNRSLALRQLRPLLDVPGVAFAALQLGAARGQVGRVFGRAPVANVATEIRGFADTMAILDNLDLLISVDTSVAHLAGAMGRPGWVLLPYPADWRWLESGDIAPWYPTLRLFRQVTPGDWPPVIAQAAETLRLWARRGAADAAGLGQVRRQQPAG